MCLEDKVLGLVRIIPAMEAILFMTKLLINNLLSQLQSASSSQTSLLPLLKPNVCWLARTFQPVTAKMRFVFGLSTFMRSISIQFRHLLNLCMYLPLFSQSNYFIQTLIFLWTCHHCYSEWLHKFALQNSTNNCISQDHPSIELAHFLTRNKSVI